MVLVWTAITLMVLIGFVGLSIDWGKVCLNVHQLQNAADAAALAGAQHVKLDQVMARDRAVALGLANPAERRDVSVDRNEGNDPNGELVLGRWITQRREFIPTLIAPNAVKVVARRIGQRDDAPELAMLFGPIFGTPTVAASRPAIAVSTVSVGAGIICLAENPKTLDAWNYDSGLILGGGTGAVLDLRGPDGWPADIQINAASDDEPWESFRLNGSAADLYVGDLNAHGTTNPDADDADAWAALSVDGMLSVNPYSEMVDDPLINEVAPVISALPVGTDTNGKIYGTADTILGGTLTLNPGYYPGGINLTGGNITLLPGIYAFGGGANGKSGFVTNGGFIDGEGVMIYVTGDEANGVKYGKIDVGGNAALNLVSRGDALPTPDVNGAMGVVLWQDRENPNYAKVIGGGDCDMTGTIYCGYNALELGGTFDQMGNQVIAGALDIHGSIQLGVGYDGRNFVQMGGSGLAE